jgi:RimJ/RimL family protein N-acetyltransferase
MKNKDHLFIVDRQYFKKLKLLSDNKPVHIKVDIENRIINSFRLDLIPLKKDDMPEYYRLYSDAKVVEKYCRGEPRSPVEIDELLSPYFYDKEPSYFSIFKKGSSDFMGTIVLTSKNQSPGTFVLGYLLHTDYWGNNYAKEALYSLLFCLFPIIRKEALTISATTRSDNPASKYILESFNFRYIEETEKFGKNRLVYELDTKEVVKIHKNIQIFDIGSFNKNIGVIFLTSSDLIENSHLYKYLLKEIISPILPYQSPSQIEQLLKLIPQENSYWITTHFIVSSLGYFALSSQNPGFSFLSKFSLPLINTIGYSSKLLISDLHQNLVQERIKGNFDNNLGFTTDSFLDNCFYEIALSTTSGFIFSLPAALSFAPFGLSYSAFSTISSFTSSAVSCAYSNKLLISPSDISISAKIIPYIVDSIVAFSTINSFSFHSIHSLTEVALNVKKISFIVSSVVSADHISKSLIELSPDETFKYLDSFFGFEQNVDSNNSEL